MTYEPFLAQLGSREVARLVFRDAAGNQGLLGVDPQDCLLVVSVIRNADGWHHLQAEAYCESDGGGDGWYGLLEDYSCNPDVFGGDVPEGVTWAGFDNGYGWSFSSGEVALAMAAEWAGRTNVQLVSKETMKC